MFNINFMLNVFLSIQYSFSITHLTEKQCSQLISALHQFIMIIPEEVICKTCEKVFCCSECREKHELKTHAIVVHCPGNEAVLHLFCPICQQMPLVLKAEMRNELLLHIAENHLPLNCRKCFRQYTRFDDLLEFTKCVQKDIPCKLQISEISALQVDKESSLPSQRNFSSISAQTQTSPIRVAEINDSHITPISMINLRWKAKSKLAEEFISDSVSSIKNISLISNSSIRKSIGIGLPVTKGKLVRSTSTPLQAEILAKPKEQAFNVSGGHVSSIYHSGSDVECSPPLVQAIGSTPSKRPVDTVNRYQKPRARAKMSVAVTPLRQVMSKSIQKAIAEHGIAGTRGVGYNRKKMFDSIDTSGDISEKSNELSPLDLRTSPAVRRTQSENVHTDSHLDLLKTIPKASAQMLHREILLSATKKMTESIVITSSTAESIANSNKSNQSGNSVYQTCRSVEIITSTSTELNEVNVQQNDIILKTKMLPVGIPPVTPRIPTSKVLTNKKLINFETPVITQKYKVEKQSPDEKFFTPSSTPLKTSRISKKSHFGNSWGDSLPRKFYSMEEQEDKIESFGSDYTDVVFDDEVFVENKKPERGKSKLWSLVASMIRLPSINSRDENGKLNDDNTFNTNSTSLIKRCASFAGSLVRQKSIAEEENVQAMKRKRTYTTDSQTTFSLSKGNCTDFDLTCSESKRFRIHGRKPIERMRCNY